MAGIGCHITWPKEAKLVDYVVITSGQRKPSIFTFFSKQKNVKLSLLPLARLARLGNPLEESKHLIMEDCRLLADDVANTFQAWVWRRLFYYYQMYNFLIRKL